MEGVCELQYTLCFTTLEEASVYPNSCYLLCDGRELANGDELGLNWGENEHIQKLSNTFDVISKELNIKK